MIELEPSSLRTGPGSLEQTEQGAAHRGSMDGCMGKPQVEAQADGASAQKEGLSWNDSASRWRSTKA